MGSTKCLFYPPLILWSLCFCVPLCALLLASQLVVSASPPKVLVGSGEALELLCNVSGVQISPLLHAAYSVGWQRSKGAAGEGHLVAQLDTDGTVILGKSYANRDVGRRHVSLQKLSPAVGTYRLRIESAQPGDVGTYWCVVRAFVLSPTADRREAVSRRSEPLMVDMKTEGMDCK